MKRMTFGFIKRNLLQCVWRFLHFHTPSNTDSCGKKVWFSKAEAFVSHARSFSKLFVSRPDIALALDEMIVRFSGRFSETYRIKAKQIGEG